MEYPIDKPMQKDRVHSVAISTTVSSNFWQQAKDNNISWSEAMRVGICILLAERGQGDYDNQLNIYRKMRFFQTEAEKNMQKVDQLEAQLTELQAKRASGIIDNIKEEKELNG